METKWWMWFSVCRLNYTHQYSVLIWTGEPAPSKLLLRNYVLQFLDAWCCHLLLAMTRAWTKLICIVEGSCARRLSHIYLFICVINLFIFMCLFIVYLTTLSVAQTIERRMIKWSMNNELETTWQEAVVA
jgi:hypothetical protein